MNCIYENMELCSNGFLSGIICPRGVHIVGVPQHCDVKRTCIIMTVTVRMIAFSKYILILFLAQLVTEK